MPLAARCYVTAIMITALGVMLTLPWSRSPIPVMLALCALAMAAERLSRVTVSARGITVSVSLVVTLIAVLLLPPASAAVVGMAGGVVLVNRRTLFRSGFNVAIFALIPAGGSAVCHLLRGHDTGVYLKFPVFLIPYVAATTTCLALNGLFVTTVIRLSGKGSFWALWRGDLLRVTMPYYTSSVLALIIVVLWNDIGPFTVLLVILPVYMSHWVFAQYSREQAAYEDTISALVQAVEIKDHYTRGHSERVAKGAELIARRIAMSEERVAKLRYAGLLHDIGKLGVPTRLLAKSGKLTDEEYALLCLHPNQGVAVIRDIRFLTDVYDGILYHHERLDGRGYPSGRSGDEIPEFARILGVADAFDAMTSTRSYRAARPVPEALAELWRGAGTQFDPALVRAFEEALELQAAAGHAWQVTDEPVPGLDVMVAGGAAGPVFVFEDHDDPTAGQAWYPNRAGDSAEGAGTEVVGHADGPAGRPVGGPDAGTRGGEAWFARATRGRGAVPEPLPGRREVVEGMMRSRPPAEPSTYRRPPTRSWDLAESFPMPTREPAGSEQYDNVFPIRPENRAAGPVEDSGEPLDRAEGPGA